MLRPGTHASSHQNFSKFSAQLLDGLNHSKKSPPQASHSGKLVVREDSNHFTISLEFSQFDEATLDLWVEDHQLTLIADERSPCFSKGKKPSSFFSSINLPGDVDEDSIKAELINARLEIRFTKDRTNASTEF